MTIKLTENAGKFIQQQLIKMKPGTLLRVGIKKSGCSGNSYTFDYAEQIDQSDHLFEFQDVKIVINSDALPFLQGSEIDFVKDGLNSAFRVSNPNVDNTCGCGDSFSMKEQGVEQRS